jgi:multiple sugar transport system substrate-binding protein
VRITHFPQVDANWFTGLLWQNQASLFELEGDNISVTVDSPESQEVAQYWQRMIDEDLIATNLQGFSPDLYAAVEQRHRRQLGVRGVGLLDHSRQRPRHLRAVGRRAHAEVGGRRGQRRQLGRLDDRRAHRHRAPGRGGRVRLWLNTDPASLEILNREGGLFPAATAGEDLPALSEGVEFYGGQPIFDVFREASGQVDTDFTWGPTMTDTYRAMSDGFTAALNGQGSLGDALGAAQTASVESLRAQGIQVDG